MRRRRIGPTVVTVLISFSTGVAPAAPAPSTEWRGVYAALLQEGDCNAAYDVLMGVRRGGVIPAPEDYARFDATCAPLNPALKQPPRDFTPAEHLPASAAAYRDACPIVKKPYQDDPQAVTRSAQKAKGEDALWMTPLEKRRAACAHRALETARAVEAAGDQPTATLWFREAYHQSAPAADFAFGIRRLDGRIPLTLLSVRSRDNAMAEAWAEAANQVLSAAYLDYPPAYVPAAELILDGFANPHGELPQVYYRGWTHVTPCLLTRARMAHADGPEADRAKIGALLARAGSQLEPHIFGQGVAEGRSGISSCAGVRPEDVVELYGRYGTADLATRQAWVSGRLLD